jgi:hypothetical protein
MRAWGVAGLVLAAASLSAQTTPTSYASGRLAAWQFAVANGFTLRSPDSMVVMIESHFDRAATGVQPHTGALIRESREIAASIGPRVATVPATSVLKCDPRCATSSRMSVVSVSELNLNDKPPGDCRGCTPSGVPSVLVRVYDAAPSDTSRRTLTSAVVELRQSSGGWVAVRFRLGPATVRVRTTPPR